MNSKNQVVRDICKVLQYLSISPENTVSCNGKIVVMDSNHNVLLRYEGKQEEIRYSELTDIVKEMRATDKNALRRIEIDVMYSQAG